MILTIRKDITIVMKWTDALTTQTRWFIKSIEPIISVSGALDKSHFSNMHTLLTGNCDRMNSMYDCSPHAGYLDDSTVISGGPGRSGALLWMC